MRQESILVFLFAFGLSCSSQPTEKIQFRKLESSPYLVRTAEQIINNDKSDHLTYIDRITFNIDSELPTAESYRIEFENHQLNIFSSHINGALYAVSDLREQLNSGEDQFPFKIINTPSFPVRAIKFNLPWSAYRESASMNIHEETCRDPEFWKSFLDMMLENRFNTLLLYNKHPFPFMIKLSDYPEACPFSDEEMREWNLFWKELFSMAKERAIDIFIVNWNIVVSPTFAKKNNIPEYNDTSQLTIDYTKESVKALINEYPDLAGVGVTLADWMNGMSPAEKETWIEKTFISGMKEADREVKFLHRAVLSGSAEEMRKILDKAQFSYPTNVEVKFNWSHGHSTPKLLITHASEAGEVNTAFWNPKPKNYSIQWMIRNEDFFILPWGDPEFVRQHIHLNKHSFVSGYHIGSEGYIPALNYFDRSPDAPKYAFQRQWLFYKLWGRLLYNDEIENDFFENYINKKLGIAQGRDVLNLYQYASRMPLTLASFFKSTWDYTLYSEGFLAPVIRTQYGVDDHESPFISITELMHHQTLDTSYLSIEQAEDLRQQGKKAKPDKITPATLANQLMSNADSVFYVVDKLKLSAPDISALAGLEGMNIWAYISQYFAYKLKAASLLAEYVNTRDKKIKSEAISDLTEALQIWQKLSTLADQYYHEVPYWESRVFNRDSSINNFSWSKYLPQVKRDLETAEKL